MGLHFEGIPGRITEFAAILMLDESDYSIRPVKSTMRVALEERIDEAAQRMGRLGALAWSL